MLSTTCGRIADDFRCNVANLRTHCQYEEQAQQNVDDKTLKQVCRVNDYSLSITSSRSITLVVYRKKLWISLPTTYPFLGAFAKLQRATISFVMCLSVCLSVCPSVRQHEITRSALDGFPLLFIFEYLSNIYRKFKFHYNLTGIAGTLHDDIYTFMIISLLIILRMRNVPDKSCRENQNTHFMFNNVFPKIVSCGKTW